MTEGLWGDVRVAARRLTTTPLFLVFAVLSLAVGLSVTVVAYSLVESQIWRHTGMANSDRVAFVTTRAENVLFVGGVPVPLPARVSRQDFVDLAGAQRTFASIGAATRVSGVLGTPGDSGAINGEAVTGDYFMVSGVTAIAGRTITRSDVDAAARVIVVPKRVWRQRLGGASDAIGTTVRFAGVPFQVVGIVPDTFTGAVGGMSPAAWIPFTAMQGLGPESVRTTSTRDTRELTVVGRLRDDRTLAQASAELAAIGSELNRVAPLTAPSDGPGSAPRLRGWGAASIDSQDPLGGRIGWFLIAMVATVLLVASTNLASLMLARGSLRQRELGVRRALGGTRWRLVRAFVVESGMIAGVGLIAATALIRLMLVLIPESMTIDARTITLHPTLSPSAIAFALGVLLLSLLAFGVEPALQLTKTSVLTDLPGTPGIPAIPGARRQWWLIRAQVAVCACFFAICGILVRVVVAEAQHDAGIDVEHLAVTQIVSTPNWTTDRTIAVARRAAADARAHGERDVVVTSGLPLGTGLIYVDVMTPDAPFEPSRNNRGGWRGGLLIAGDPGLLEVLGVRLVAGRRFTSLDTVGSRSVAIINESTAHRLFGPSSPLDREIAIRERGVLRSLVVVGVTRDTDTRVLYEREAGTVYVPLAQQVGTATFTPNLYLVARSDTPARAAAQLRQAIFRADPDLGAGFSGSGVIIMAGEYLAARAAAALASGLGAIALLLAMVGLFGVQSQVVVRRTREIGLRVALGATAARIRGLLISQGMTPVLQGVITGLVFSTIVRLGMRALLPFPIDLLDPLALLLVPVPLAVAAYLACRLPASRAARVDPNVALRQV